MSIVITGASGQLGRLTADAVIEKIGAERVVLVTRHPDRLADFAERGADVRAGDFDDPASLPAAFAGGERLLLISTHQIGARVPGHKAAVDAAAAAGVRSIAYTSMINPSHSNPVVVAPEHRATEEHIRASGVAWTFLRNGIYAEMLLQGAAAALATGTHLSNDGDGRVSYVSREDCAAAAAAVMTSDGHEGEVIDITGPEAVGARQVAALIGELGGREVEAALVDDEAYVQAMVRHGGLPEPAARAYATFGTATRHWYLAPVSTAVQELTGRAPRSVRDVLSEGLVPA
jgi:NAD(P)H dehydrogenase (quinone)